MKTTQSTSSGTTVRQVPVNGIRKCTCGKRVEMVGWRVGGLYKFFCSAECARTEETRLNSVRASAGLPAIHDLT